MALEFEVTSDLYDAGATENGQRYHAETFFILATDGEGNRWKHYMRFNGCVVEPDDEGINHFHDVREAAKTAAASLLEKIKDASAVNLDCYWAPTFPVYGSPAYFKF